ncbi:MAG: GreA/GreB family elongation factor, partial [Chloroflexi bacterium]|nr:GreA/GreB family elongation factor [Chloroflexota bacterium]
KIEAIRLAAMDKDFRENAPLDAARETHSYAESRIKELEETLRRAVVVTKQTSRERGVGVGSRVTLYDLQNERSVKYTLVDSSEADPAGGKISVVSPVGAAVLGAVVGDEVAVRAPKGERKYRVTAVES